MLPLIWKIISSAFQNSYIFLTYFNRKLYKMLSNFIVTFNVATVSERCYVTCLGRFYTKTKNDKPPIFQVAGRDEAMYASCGIKYHNIA